MMLGNIMYQADFNPFSECLRFFSSFACGGPWSGRHFYTRKERIEALETTKKRLQDEIAAIDEMIADLKSREPKQAASLSTGFTVRVQPLTFAEVEERVQAGRSDGIERLR